MKALEESHKLCGKKQQQQQHQHSDWLQNTQQGWQIISYCIKMIDWILVNDDLPC